MQKYIETLYVKKPVKRQAESTITKYDIIKKHHKFLRDSDSSSDSDSDSDQNKQRKPKAKLTEQQKEYKISKQYYDSLYKEYALADLSRYETGQIGCRWRTEKEVIKSKGEKICGALKCKKESKNVYEMNFGYVEEGEKKNALVKISVCKQCGIKLNHSKKLKQIIQKVKLEHNQEQPVPSD